MNLRTRISLKHRLRNNNKRKKRTKKRKNIFREYIHNIVPILNNASILCDQRRPTPICHSEPIRVWRPFMFETTPMSLPC